MLGNLRRLGGQLQLSPQLLPVQKKWATAILVDAGVGVGGSLVPLPSTGKNNILFVKSLICLKSDENSLKKARQFLQESAQLHHIR